MPLTRRNWLALCAAGVASGAAPLQEQFRQIAAATDGTVGISALHLATGRRASWNGGQRFPLASVCKLPIAMQMLALVDSGRHSLAGEIEVLPQDILPWVSPIAERWPRQRRFPLDEMLRLMLQQSDNTAVQTLYRVGGGSQALAERLRQWKIDGLRIDRTEGQCTLDAAGVTHAPPAEQRTGAVITKLLAGTTPAARHAALLRFIDDPRDTATPDATVQLLARAFRGDLLRPPTTARLQQMLEGTVTGQQRLRGLLPANTVVAHKTGTTATEQGLNGGTNDVGVITLPNGKLAIAIYIKASTRSLAVRERVIARAALAAFTAFRDPL